MVFHMGFIAIFLSLSNGARSIYIGFHFVEHDFVARTHARARACVCVFSLSFSFSFGFFYSRSISPIRCLQRNHNIVSNAYGITNLFNIESM